MDKSFYLSCYSSLLDDVYFIAALSKLFVTHVIILTLGKSQEVLVPDTVSQFEGGYILMFLGAFLSQG